MTDHLDDRLTFPGAGRRGGRSTGPGDTKEQRMAVRLEVTTKTDPYRYAVDITDPAAEQEAHAMEAGWAGRSPQDWYALVDPVAGPTNVYVRDIIAVSVTTDEAAF